MMDNSTLFMMIQKLKKEIGVTKKVKDFSYMVEATSEGQTTFAIPHPSFDVCTCSLFVQSGRTILLQGEDYTVEGTDIILTEGVPNGRTIGIVVMTILNDSIAIQEADGSCIAAGTLPLNRFAGGMQKQVPTKTENGVEWQDISTTYEITVGTVWEGEAAPFTQEITVAGITANDNPITDLLTSADYELSVTERAEYSKIADIETFDGKVVVTADAETEVDLIVRLKVVAE